MDFFGVNYDTGTSTTNGGLTREQFDHGIVAKEIAIIKNELHCNAIRISGIFIERISIAAKLALEMGMDVWYSPSLPYRGQAETLQFLVEAAKSAEELRKKFPGLVFVAGCELSLFTHGFVKGNSGEERVKHLFSPVSLAKRMIGLPETFNRKLRNFLKRAIVEIRKHFGGKISYASGSWEKIDWRIFDFVGVDLYRSSFNKKIYQAELRRYIHLGKPVCIMEFGCCTYRGAEEKGGIGWAIVDWAQKRPILKGDYQRDESVQANHLLELLEIFRNEKVFAAFVFTFILSNYVYDEEPRCDLDMASYGIVRKLKHGVPGYQNLGWLPKLSFTTLANYFSTLALTEPGADQKK